MLVWQTCHMSVENQISFCQCWFSLSVAPPAILWANECTGAVSYTWASTRRCLIRVMDFCSVSFSGGIKACSSCSRGLGPVTMKFAIWSFRLFKDCTARGRHKNKSHRKQAANVQSICSIWILTWWLKISVISLVNHTFTENSPYCPGQNSITKDN